MIRIVNYIDIVSNSLLEYLNITEMNSHDNISYFINPNNDFFDKMNFLIKSNLKNERYFGYTNIILNTCKPKHNWRNRKSIGSTIQDKYKLTDESNIETENLRFQKIIDDIYNNCINEFKDYKFIFHENVDIEDLEILIHSNIGQSISCKKPSYYTVTDYNIQQFQHSKSDIPSYIYSNIDRILIENKLI